MKQVLMRGIPASPGIAIAPARTVDRQRIKIARIRIDPDDAPREVGRLERAVSEAKAQLVAARAMLDGAAVVHGDPGLVLQAHLLMLDDDLLIRGAVREISSELINAEWALSRKMDEIKADLDRLGSEYFRERSQDVDFVGNRVLRILLGQATAILEDECAQGEECVVVADNLSPAETAHMVETPIVGFATEEGTSTSHTAIMAQALGIPAVVGVDLLVERVAAGDAVIVDGVEGVVIARPDERTLREYRERGRRWAEAERRMRATRDRPAVTTDGTGVRLLANIELPAEAPLALEYGAEGIGLYRTEFVFLERETLPDEDEQADTYRAIVETMQPHPVVFRTFDLGADKLPGYASSRERNPALGLRAIRIGLRNRAMLKTQLRALLRAGETGELGIMFPMISGVGELRQAKSLLEETRREMWGDGGPTVRVGCMIELPSAVFVADQLARESDFFSIGTNDLIQYSLAIDRGNDHVAYLYTPYHPGVLRAVRQTVAAAEAAGIPVAMCGGMAAEPSMAPVLVGMGLRDLSMAPTSIPHVKLAVRSIALGEAEDLARRALDMRTALEVEDLVRTYMEGRPDAGAE